MLAFSRPPIGSLQAQPIAFEEFPDSYFWLWVARNWFFGDTPLEEWEELTPYEAPYLIIASQLNEVGEGRSATGPTDQVFVKKEDLAFAERYPVLLTQRSPATEPPQKPSEVLIGTCGIVIDLDYGTLWLYTLDALGEVGKDIWSRLKKGATTTPRHELLKGMLDVDVGFSVQNELENRVSHEWWSQSQQAARELAQLYYQLHQRLVPPQTLPFAPQVSRPLPPTKNVMHGQRLLIPQLEPVEGVLLALSHAPKGEQGGWKEIDAIPTYVHRRPTSVTEVTVRPRDVELVSGDITKQLWQHVRQFNDVDGDIFLAMLAQYLGTPPATDDDGGVWITTNQILEYRGIQQKTHRKERPKKGEVSHRKAGHRLEDMQEVADGVDRIRDTHLTIRMWKENHKRKRSATKTTRKRIYKQESYLFTISDYIEQSQLLFEEDAPVVETNLQIAWRFLPGSCLNALLGGPNYRAATLLQQALRYDPYHEMWEKRLARYFTFQMRINAEFGGTTIRRTIGTLLDELALAPNTVDPKKTRERFEKAMKRLQEDKIISHWGPEAVYQQTMKHLPRYNWFEDWLACEIEVSVDPLPTERAQEMLEHVQERKKRRVPLLEEPDDRREAIPNNEQDREKNDG